MRRASPWRPSPPSTWTWEPWPWKIPGFTCSGDQSGQWNVSRLLKKEETPAKPAEPQGLVEKIAPYLFRGLDLSNLEVHRGELFITEGGHTRHYSDLDLKANLTFLNWGQPQQKVKVDITNLGITTPQGRAELEARVDL